MITPLRWCARIAGLLALVIGLLLSRMPSAALFHLHMTLGGIVAVALLLCALLALGKVPVAKAAPGIPWALATLLLGMRQNELLPGSMHWLIEVLHAVMGIGAIGLTEMIGAAQTRAAR